MENYSEFFSGVFLFDSLPKEKLLRAISEAEPELRSYSRGDVIYSPDNYEKEIGFIYSGDCEILRRKSDGIDVSLNILKPGNSFGILAVLSQEEFPTVVVANHNAKVFFIRKTKLMRLIRHYPTIAMNVINFLGKKIVFLNKKITTFSSDTTTEKLARYISAESLRCGATEFTLNCKKCSEELNVGRASVYRAIDSLVKSGIITYENKKIFILDQEGLERMKK